MGYVFAVAPCICCKQPFSFNPVRVPSIIVNGAREPICQTCVPHINSIRRDNGLDEIVPLPGAYEECHESELG